MLTLSSNNSLNLRILLKRRVLRGGGNTVCVQEQQPELNICIKWGQIRRLQDYG